MTQTNVLEVDLTDPALYSGGRLHDVFAELRAAGGVHRNPPVDIGLGREAPPFWSVVRHAEIQRANRDFESLSSADGVALPKHADGTAKSLTAMDPPGHTRMRRLITAGFTPRMVGRLETHIGERTRRILDEAADRADCDLVRDIAYQLPMHVIADIVGIDEADRSWVFERTETVIRAFDPTSGLTADDQRRAERDLFGYAEGLARHKRAQPTDDVWTLIAQAEIVDDDGVVHRLEGGELDMFFVLLAIAGSETTRNAISQGLLALLDHPEQFDALRADPALLPLAAEEMIRWASPVLYFARTATRDFELGGVHIAEGERVVLWYPSGNRDERAFLDPFCFNIRRNPNPHVSFGGGGPHYCLGANLARKEVQSMIGALVADFDMRVTGPPRWTAAGGASNVGMSIDRLPVQLTRRRPS